MRSLELSQLHIVLAIFVVLFAVLSLFVPGFATIGNLLTLVQNVSVLGILALGMAIVVVGRGIDVSIVASAAVCAGLVLQLAPDGVGQAFAAGLGLALLLGLVNGALVAYADIPPLFVTLATGLFLAGLGQTAFFSLVTVEWPRALDGIAFLGKGSVLGIPAPAASLAVGVLGVGALLGVTRLGGFIYAIGVNPAAARAAGLPTRPVTVIQYVLSALVGALAGLVLAASVNNMPTRIFDSTLVYDVILVVVLGGVSLNGGRGSVANVIAGTLLIGTLLNGMTIVNLDYSAQNLVKGVVLLLTTIIDAVINPRNEETSQHGDI